MTDTITLRKLAEAATQGPWTANKHGTVIGGITRQYFKGAGKDQLFMACVVGEENSGDQESNASYISAANPVAIIALLDEIDALRAALAQQAEPAIKFRHGCQWCGKQNCTMHPIAQQAEQGWQPTESAMDALRRFEETCTDNEGYDVPKDTMRNLQAIGLIYRTYGDMYCITDFGHHMLAAAPKGGVV